MFGSRLKLLGSQFRPWLVASLGVVLGLSAVFIVSVALRGSTPTVPQIRAALWRLSQSSRAGLGALRWRYLPGFAISADEEHAAINKAMQAVCSQLEVREYEGFVLLSDKNLRPGLVLSLPRHRVRIVSNDDLRRLAEERGDVAYVGLERLSYTPGALEFRLFSTIRVSKAQEARVMVLCCWSATARCSAPSRGWQCEIDDIVVY